MIIVALSGVLIASIALILVAYTSYKRKGQRESDHNVRISKTELEDSKMDATPTASPETGGKMAVGAANASGSSLAADGIDVPKIIGSVEAPTGRYSSTGRSIPLVWQGSFGRFYRKRPSLENLNTDLNAAAVTRAEAGMRI